MGAAAPPKKRKTSYSSQHLALYAPLKAQYPAPPSPARSHGSPWKHRAGHQPGPRRCKPARLPTPIRSSSLFSSVLLPCLTPSAAPALWLLGSSPPRVFAQLKRRDARPREDLQIAATPRRQSDGNLQDCRLQPPFDKSPPTADASSKYQGQVVTSFLIHLLLSQFVN